MTDLIASFHTPQGLVSIIGQARSLIIAIALILVTANLAAEWTQGTLRNLLVREPHRLRWLAGKMLAVVLFVLLSMLLTLVISSTFILILAQGQGIQTTAWTSAEGLRIFLAFFGNEVLCLIGVSALGMFIAVLTRSVVAAVGIALAYILVFEGIIARGRAAGVPVVSRSGVQHHCRSDGADRGSHPYPGLSGGPVASRAVDRWLCRGRAPSCSRARMSTHNTWEGAS